MKSPIAPYDLTSTSTRIATPVAPAAAAHAEFDRARMHHQSS
jgi:hypothetical protein